MTEIAHRTETALDAASGPLAPTEQRARLGRCVAIYAASWPRVQLGKDHCDALVVSLSDLPIDEVEHALGYCRNTMTFPPAIAEIRRVVALHRLRHPEPAEALEIVMAYTLERLKPRRVPCGCRDGWNEHEVCNRCRGEGTVAVFTVELPEPARRALNLIGGHQGIAESDKPGIVRREFVRYYEEFRRQDEEAIVAGRFAVPAPGPREGSTT